jgi:hypothetical protein
MWNVVSRSHLIDLIDVLPCVQPEDHDQSDAGKASDRTELESHASYDNAEQLAPLISDFLKVMA